MTNENVNNVNAAPQKAEKEKPQAVAAVAVQANIEMCPDVNSNITYKSENASQAQEILAKISADLPYPDWFRVAAALKNSGCRFELFDNWSKTSPDKYDEAMAEQVWEDAGKDRAERVGIGTLHYIAAHYDGTIVPAPETMLEAPKTQEEMAQQAAEFVDHHYRPGDVFEVCSKVATDAKGKTHPDRPNGELMGANDNEMTEENLKLWAARIADNQNGAWCSLNPINKEIKGNAPSDADVTEFRYALVEADEESKEKQWGQLRDLELPIHSVVWSGGKSLHAIVKIDAGNDAALYKARVKLLYEFLKQHGFNVDRANKNPSRLTRIPGFRRGDDVQYLVAKYFGAKDWNTFERMVLQKNDHRSETSAVNGALGGRTAKDTSGLARAALQFIGEGMLKKYGDHWFRWKKRDESWHRVALSELRATISHFLQSPDAGLDGERISGGLIADTIECISGADDLFLDPDFIHQPCFLPGGESAERFIAFSNGLLNIDDAISKPLTECKLRPIDPSFFGRRDVDFAFDASAQCPRWLDAVDKMLPDKEMQLVLQQIFGYIIGRGVDLNVFFLIYGPAGTGKSTTIDIIRALIGEQNCCAIPLQELGGQFNGGELTDKLLNAVEELSANSKNIDRAENLLKIATGGGMLKVERKFENVASGRCHARHIFSCNELPTFSDRSRGLWDRLVLLPFTTVIRGTDEQKKNVKSDLLAELPGICNWALAGLRSLKEATTFPIPDFIKELIEKERQRCDVEGSFVRDVLVKGNPHDIVTCNELVRLYHEHVDALGLPAKPVGALNEAVKISFPSASKSHTNIYGKDTQIFRGVALRSSLPSPFYPGTPPPPLIETADGRAGGR